LNWQKAKLERRASNGEEESQKETEEESKEESKKKISSEVL